MNLRIIRSYKTFVCELDFGGEGKGREGLWRGKPLFESFKKTGKGFGGFKGFHLSNFKVPLNWRVLEG